MESTRRTREITGPKRVNPRQQEDTRLPVDRQLQAQPPFRFGHYPGNWEWTEEHGFLPRLTTLSAVPGVNGNRREGPATAKSGPVNMNGFISGFTEKGGTYINPEDTRLGPYADYAGHAYERKDGALHFVMPWEQMTVLPTGRIKVDEAHNHAEWQRFRVQIRDSGIIEPLHHSTIVDMLDRLETRRNRLESREPTEANKKQLARIEKQIAGITAAWEAHEAELTETAGAMSVKPKRTKKTAGAASV